MAHSLFKLPLLMAGLLLMLLSSSAVQAGNTFSPDQKAEIHQLIRDYILENPEILPEAIGILQQRMQSQSLIQYHDQLYKDGYSYVGGNPDGDVTLIEFFDYNCGYCKSTLAAMEKLKQQDPGLRVIYKELPVLAESSYTAAKAAMAAAKQGKYMAFHLALLKNTEPLDEKLIFEIARTVGLDDKALAQDMTDPTLDRNLQINRQLAQALRITGTPGFIIGEQIIPGALPYDQLAALIQTARMQAKN